MFSSYKFTFNFNKLISLSIKKFYYNESVFFVLLE